MYCTYCGKGIPDKANFCPFCGNKLPLGSSISKGRREEDERKETSIQPVANPAVEPPPPPVSTRHPKFASKENLENEQLSPLHKALLEGQHERERELRLQELKDLLERNLITKEDFEKRKSEIS